MLQRRISVLRLLIVKNGMSLRECSTFHILAGHSNVSVAFHAESSEREEDFVAVDMSMFLPSEHSLSPVLPRFASSYLMDMESFRGLSNGFANLFKNAL